MSKDKKDNNVQPRPTGNGQPAPSQNAGEQAGRLLGGLLGSVVNRVERVVEGAARTGVAGALGKIDFSTLAIVGVGAALLSQIGSKLDASLASAKNPLDMLKVMNKELATAKGDDGKPLTQKAKDDIMATKLAEQTGMKIEEAKAAVGQYRKTPNATPVQFDQAMQKLSDGAAGGFKWVKEQAGSVAESVTPSSQAIKDAQGKAEQGFKDATTGVSNALGAAGNWLKQEMKKPPAAGFDPNGNAP